MTSAFSPASRAEVGAEVGGEVEELGGREVLLLGVDAPWISCIE